MELNHSRKVALVVSYSDILSDPRVRRQIDWLAADGYVVDTLGRNAEKSPNVRRHFQFSALQRRWTNTKLGYLLTGRLLPKKLAFKLRTLETVPTPVLSALSRGEYSLLVLNELNLLPLVSFEKIIGKKSDGMHVHVDLHERHRPDRVRDTVGGRISGPLYRWTYRHIGHPRIDSRTVVNTQIGDIYEREFGVPNLVPVRNIPFYQDLSPTPVDPDHIKMVFHGLPSGERGFKQILEALEHLPPTFSMDFMITPAPRTHAWLREQIAQHPAADRIKIVSPAPMDEIPQWINQYDLEIIYYSKGKENLKFALPNKFFEAIQGRLGLVVADGSAMAPAVRKWGNGVVVPGHDGKLLADALGNLTADDVAGFKDASDSVARRINAEAEGAVFLQALSSRGR